MNFIRVKINEGIATVFLNRGKVNALNGEVVDELRKTLEALAANKDLKAIILTGHGKFFSFGFDIPEFLSFSKEEFTDYLIKFTDLYTYLFLYPKPVVAALNGHTIAGGCMLALACDERLMVDGNGKISLNEISFGSSVFAGSTEILRFWTGSANATKILCSGAMYSAKEALSVGLVDTVVTEQNLMVQAGRSASELTLTQLPAFTSIKSLLRKPIVQEMIKRERESIREFVDIWYSEATWKNLQNIRIHSDRQD